MPCPAQASWRSTRRTGSRTAGTPDGIRVARVRSRCTPPATGCTSGATPVGTNTSTCPGSRSSPSPAVPRRPPPVTTVALQRLSGRFSPVAPRPPIRRSRRSGLPGHEQDGDRSLDAATASNVAWGASRGAFMVGNQLYWSAPDPNETTPTPCTGRRSTARFRHRDRRSLRRSAWSGVKTGSGQTYQGVKPSKYAEMASVTGQFFADGKIFYSLAGQKSLYWRYFEPDDGIVGQTEGRLTGVDFSESKACSVRETRSIRRQEQRRAPHGPVPARRAVAGRIGRRRHGQRLARAQPVSRRHSVVHRPADGQSDCVVRRSQLHFPRRDVRRFDDQRLGLGLRRRLERSGQKSSTPTRTRASGRRPERRRRHGAVTSRTVTVEPHCRSGSSARRTQRGSGRSRASRRRAAYSPGTPSCCSSRSPRPGSPVPREGSPMAVGRPRVQRAVDHPGLPAHRRRARFRRDGDRPVQPTNKIRSPVRRLPKRRSTGWRVAPVMTATPVATWGRQSR